MPDRLTHTNRGFALHADITDSYGARVQVVESSAATVQGVDRGPWCWIYIAGGGVEKNDGAAHLDPQQARDVRDALTEWLDSLQEIR